MKNGNKNFIYAIPFFVVFTAVTFIAWLLPLRPDSSTDEKRELAEFPEFSAEALVSGDYFEAIDTWFSDTFTFRDEWISLAQSLRSCYGTSDIAIYGKIDASDKIPEKPTEPTIAPTPTDEPEEWTGKVVTEEDFISFGTVLQIDDACYEYFYFYQAGAERFAGLISRAAEICGDRANVYSVLVPTAIGVMFSPEYMEEIGSASQKDAIDFIYGSMQGVTGINTFDTLSEHNDEYLYFRTDHHWTARGAYHVYCEFCREKGFEAPPLSDFEEKVFDNFKGTLYSYANRSSLLKPDTVHAFVPPGDIETIITTDGGSTYGIDIICDMTNAASGLKYLCFMSGDNPITHITNHSMEEGPTALVIKDSFGNCFTPYLTQNYKEIYVIDYRSYRKMTLSGMLDSFAPDDVIFVNSLTISQADVTTSYLAKVIG